MEEEDQLSGSEMPEKGLQATNDHLEDSETTIDDLRRQQGDNEKDVEETADQSGVETTDERKQFGDDGEHKD